MGLQSSRKLPKAHWEYLHNIRRQPEWWGATATVLHTAVRALRSTIVDTEKRGLAESSVREMDAEIPLDGAVPISVLRRLDLDLPTYMLAGLALENAFKGLIVAKAREAGVPEPRWINTRHELAVLAKEAGISCSNGERQALELLTEFVVWRGRYPVAKVAEKMEQDGYNPDEVFAHYTELLRRAYGLLPH